MKPASILILLLALARSAFAFDVLSQSEIVNVGMVRLLAAPEVYDGKRVRVSGYLHVKFEDNALYLSKDDADHLNGGHAFWTEFNKQPGPILQSRSSEESKDLIIKNFDGLFVLLEGKFDATSFGHFGAYAGTLRDVTRIMEKIQWYEGKKQLGR